MGSALPLTLMASATLIRQHVEHDFGIRGGAQVAAVFAGDLGALLFGIGDVAVVNKIDAIGRVHKERLRLGGRKRPAVG